MTEVRKADPRARRLALAIVCAGALIGTGTILLAESSRAALTQWLTANMDWLARHPGAAALVMAVAMLPIAAFAVHLLRMAAEVVRTERYPLAGEEVIRDTPVRFGAAAVRHGRILQSLAAALLIATAVMPYWVWAFVRTLEK